MKCSKNGSLILVFVGVVLTISGSVFLAVWNTLMSKTLNNALILSNSSKSFKVWKEPPVPIYLSVYLFNWTNVDEVLESNGIVKPELKECGPYVFSQHHVRVNVVWNKNDTVSFQQKRYWKFIPSMTNGSLSDNITNVNPISDVIAHAVKNFPNVILQPAVNLLLNEFDEKLFITKTVRELLFDGYIDPLLSYVSTVANFFGIRFGLYKLGWFYNRNNSAAYEGTFNIYTGKSNLSLLGMMDKWNGLSQTSAYAGSCSTVNGSTGELYPPMPTEKISIFLADFCSALTLEERGSEKVNGINGTRFVGTDYTFDNGSKYPEQACFVHNPTVPSGVRDVSKCKFGAPAFISFPHFYLGDPSFVESVNGLRPNKNRHETYIVLEPNTGTALTGNMRLQLNLYLDHIPGLSLFRDVKPLYMPVMWFEQSATIPEYYSIQIKMLLAAMYGGPFFMSILICMGIVMTIIGSYLLHRSCRTGSFSPYNQFKDDTKGR